MTTREEAMAFGLSLPGTFADAPFHDDNWTLVRRCDTRRVFLWVYERLGSLYMNVKVEPEMGIIWRGAYAAIQPAYHMNKEHWITVRLDGSLPPQLPGALIEQSYLLTGKKQRRCKKAE
ncbi:MAG: MmcQ/YjbR family DNA-binding protein [Clostridia bacterium]|nr:MmcQ/YjbR family DNA-binding protein [Clostridia bacterium]